MRRLGRGVDERPMVTVASAVMHQSTMQLARKAGDGRVRRRWVLTLACGHEQEVGVRYTPYTERGRPRQRSRDEAKPAPRRARCDTCGTNRKITRGS